MRRPKETILLREPGQRLIVIDLDSIVALLTHYTDGKLPLNVTIKSINFSQYFSRLLGMLASSDQWQDGITNMDVKTGVLKPLQIRYEGNKVMGWHTSNECEPEWIAPPDAPKQQ